MSPYTTPVPPSSVLMIPIPFHFRRRQCHLRESPCLRVRNLSEPRVPRAWVPTTRAARRGLGNLVGRVTMDSRGLACPEDPSAFHRKHPCAFVRLSLH